MSNKKPIILAIGKTSQDVFLTSTKQFQPYHHKGVDYEQLPLGSKLHLDHVYFSTGGNAGNAAVTFARQGLHSKYMWVLGTDMSSLAILQDLDNESVDTSDVAQHAEYQPSYSTILLAPTGERTVLNYMGSDIHHFLRSFDLDAINKADWLYVSSVNDMGLLEKIFTNAKEAGVKIMMNPSGAELAETDKLKSLLEDVEVVSLNKEEAATLVEGTSLEELARHLTHYCRVVIVSDGPNGVVATDSKTVVRAGMYEDVKVVDRLGAGDAFSSGFLSKWAAGKGLADAIIFASANSTSVVTKIGAKAGILHEHVKLHAMPLHEKPF